MYQVGSNDTSWAVPSGGNNYVAFERKKKRLKLAQLIFRASSRRRSDLVEQRQGHDPREDDAPEEAELRGPETAVFGC